MKKFLEDCGLVASGQITDLGWRLLSSLLDYMKPHPNLTPNKYPSPYRIFEKIGGLVVPSALELLLIRDHKVYLAYRSDSFWEGYHVPGSLISPRETYLETARRIAAYEAPSIVIANGRVIGSPFNHSDNPRFHDLCLLFLAEFEGDPPTGEKVGDWFDKKPSNLINLHRSYWPIIQEYLL